MSEKSGLKFYSLGIVVEHKALGSDLVKVAPIEDITLVNGLLSAFKLDYSVDMPDHKGVNRQQKLKGDLQLVANWIPDGDNNRITSPNVRAGETIKIFRMADTDQYFWNTIMREPSLRRLETVNWSFSNLKDGSAAFDKDTSYWVEYSTIDKYIRMHTANNDGEPFVFDFVIDAAAGNVTIKDDVGNYVLMDSTNNRLSLTSVAGANIDLDNGHIKGHGITIDLKADSLISMEAPNIKFSGNIENNGPVTNKDTVLSEGAVSNKGGMSTEGTSTAAGGLGAEGAVSLHGDVNLTGNVTINGVQY